MYVCTSTRAYLNDDGRVFRMPPVVYFLLLTITATCGFERKCADNNYALLCCASSRTIIPLRGAQK